MSVVFEGEKLALGPAELYPFPKSFTGGSDSRLRSDVLHARVGAMPAGSLLLVHREFKVLDSTGLSGIFVEDPDLSKGRQESAHGLFFGQLVLNSEGDYDRPELVAVKPYETDVKGAIHELAANTYVNSVDGRPRAFTPLGFWRDDENGIHLITRYEHSVQSFDNIFWASPLVDPHALEPARVQKAARLSMYGLGLLHGLGMQHVDPQAKNMGTDSEKVRFIDLEESRVFPLPQGGAGKTALAREAVTVDLDIFLESCFRNANGFGDEEEGNIFEVAEPMLDDMEAAAASYQRGVCRANKISKDRYPEASRLGSDEIVAMMGRTIGAALEAAA